MMEVFTLLFALSSSGEDIPPAKPPLLAIKRIYVDRLNGTEAAAQMRDLIISSLENAKLFTITENPDRADATLRGGADDVVFTDRFSSSDGLNAHSSFNTGSSYGRSNVRAGGTSASAGVGQNESTHLEERKHEATAAVRLVDKNGDVIWSTTQESSGGKFRGASADVADRITKQLMLDYEKAKKASRN